MPCNNNRAFNGRGFDQGIPLWMLDVDSLMSILEALGLPFKGRMRVEGAYTHPKIFGLYPHG